MGRSKTGRVFKSSNCIHAGEKPGWISNSQYIAHLGGLRKFTGQMDSLLDSHGNLGNRLVFISDGATWIRNWIADAFPNAVSILDYYHAIEHLHEFSTNFFKDKEQENIWIEEQKQLLLDAQGIYEYKYSLSNADINKYSWLQLLQMQAQRHFVERGFQDARQEAGIAEYQVRGWLAWHHHMALVMLSMLFALEEKITFATNTPCYLPGM